MRFRSLALLLLGVQLMSPSASAQIPETYRYFIAATNEIHGVVSQTTVPTTEAMLKISLIACKNLSTLLDDKQFHVDLANLAKAAPRSKKDREQLRRELDLFAAQFLQVEEEWLRSAGLSDKATKELLWAAAMFRNAVDADLDANQVLNAIHNLRKEVCDAERKLKSVNDDAKRWAIVRKWVYRFGGVTIVVVDVVGAIAATVAAPPVGPAAATIAAGSSAIGGAVAAWTE